MKCCDVTCLQMQPFKDADPEVRYSQGSRQRSRELPGAQLCVASESCWSRGCRHTQAVSQSRLKRPVTSQHHTEASSNSLQFIGCSKSFNLKPNLKSFSLDFLFQFDSFSISVFFFTFNYLIIIYYIMLFLSVVLVRFLICKLSLSVRKALV